VIVPSGDRVDELRRAGSVAVIPERFVRALDGFEAVLTAVTPDAECGRAVTAAVGLWSGHDPTILILA